MFITIDNIRSNEVIVDRQMTMDDVESMRRDVANLFCNYGFPNARITMIGENGPVEEINPDQLPQYRKFNSPRDLFKKH